MSSISENIAVAAKITKEETTCRNTKLKHTRYNQTLTAGGLYFCITDKHIPECKSIITSRKTWSPFFPCIPVYNIWRTGIKWRTYW